MKKKVFFLSAVFLVLLAFALPAVAAPGAALPVPSVSSMPALAGSVVSDAFVIKVEPASPIKSYLFAIAVLQIIAVIAIAYAVYLIRRASAIAILVDPDSIMEKPCSCSGAPQPEAEKPKPTAKQRGSKQKEQSPAPPASK